MARGACHGWGPSAHGWGIGRQVALGRFVGLANLP